jgi:DNA-binding LytR/AlgR family response regulator
MENVRGLTAPHPFASPYVSYMVNLEWVERITARDVILKNRDTLPLSQKKAAQFKNTYREYMSILR